MTPNEYQIEALRTAPAINAETVALNYCALGISGEAGEFTDLFKKYIFNGHPFDKQHAAKELGDMVRYIAVAAHYLGYTFEDVLEMNVEKLRKRYPDGFDPERSINRRPEDV